MKLQVEGSAEWLKACLQVAENEQDLAAVQGALSTIRGIVTVYC